MTLSELITRLKYHIEFHPQTKDWEVTTEVVDYEDSVDGKFYIMAFLQDEAYESDS